MININTNIHININKHTHNEHNSTVEKRRRTRRGTRGSTPTAWATVPALGYYVVMLCGMVCIMLGYHVVM